MQYPKFGIYIHIPFCIQLCNYCDFNKLLRSTCNKTDIENYHKTLITEINQFFLKHPECKNISSIYFGGGTPSLYPKEKLFEILQTLKKYTDYKNIEITIEVDPKTIRKNSYQLLKNYGINRVSIGAQSFNDSILSILGRYHKQSDIIKCYYDCREAGFKNVSLDLIYGVPNQTLKIWNHDLDNIIKLNPEHVSLYNLTIAPKTFIYKHKKQLDFPSDFEQIKFYNLALKYFKSINIFQYEISNFAKIGFESKHNTDCWDLTPYIGFGVGASSYMFERRWQNISNFDKYINNQKPLRIKKLSIKDRKIEFVMLKLRKIKGFSKTEYYQKFHSDFEIDFPELLNNEFKALINVKKNIKLTQKGINLSNEIFEKLI